MNDRPEMTPEPADTRLDTLIWHALTGLQHTFCIGNERVRRYRPDVAPFAAVVDTSPESLDAVHTLVEQYGLALFSTSCALPDIAGLKVVRRAPITQMVWRGNPDDLSAETHVTLTSDDVPEMLALVEKTQPGPFGRRTIELGRYIGVRRGGKLAAMAGERMRIDGYTEVSAVCVDPAFREQGLATALTRTLMTAIHARREVPLLHVLDTNVTAIKVYQKLGFVARGGMHMTILDKMRSP